MIKQIFLLLPAYLRKGESVRIQKKHGSYYISTDHHLWIFSKNEKAIPEGYTERTNRSGIWRALYVKTT